MGDKIAFSPAKVKALKTILEGVPKKIGQRRKTLTPRSLNRITNERREITKFGVCEGQENGCIETCIQKMPRVKIKWSQKFEQFNIPDVKSPKEGLKISLAGTIPSASNPAYQVLKKAKSPRTPRSKIRCRHCEGQHWSHRCPNRIKKNESQSKQKIQNKGNNNSILSDTAPSKAGPKKKKYKFDFKVRKEGYKPRKECKWKASPRYH